MRCVTMEENHVGLVQLKMVFPVIKWHQMANPYHPWTMLL